MNYFFIRTLSSNFDGINCFLYTKSILIIATKMSIILWQNVYLIILF